MKKIILGLDRFLSLLGIGLNGVLALGVIVSVLLRYLFSIVFVQSEELLTMVFVATTFFGASLGVREGEHIGIPNFINLMNPAFRRMALTIGQGIICLLSITLVYFSGKMIAKVGGVPSPATGILKGCYYAIIPLSFAFTAFYAAVNVAKEFVPIPEPVKGYLDDADLGFECPEGE